MTLAIFERYHTLAEAGVIASLLRSAGFAPEVFDEHHGGVNWTIQTALGGYRLMLPQSDIEPALALLAEARSLASGDDPVVEEPQTEVSPPSGFVYVVAMLAMGPEIGWLVSPLLRRSRPPARMVIVTVIAFVAVLIFLWAIADRIWGMPE